MTKKDQLACLHAHYSCGFKENFGGAKDFPSPAGFSGSRRQRSAAKSPKLAQVSLNPG